MVVAAALPATVAPGLRHLESQQSLPTLEKDAPNLSALAKKLRLAPNHRVGMQRFVNNVDELTALRLRT